MKKITVAVMVMVLVVGISMYAGNRNGNGNGYGNNSNGRSNGGFTTSYSSSSNDRYSDYGSNNYGNSFRNGYGRECYNGGWDRRPGRWPDRWHGGWGRPGWYGPYGPAAFWTDFGLTAGALAISALNQPDIYVNNNQPVYQQPVQPQVVYQQAPEPQVTVVQAPAPQVIYQQSAPQQVIVQAPVQQVYTELPAYPKAEIPQQDRKIGDMPTSETINIYVSNGNGTFTIVPLTRTDTGFMGPQGEFYLDHPSVEVLKKKYVK